MSMTNFEKWKQDIKPEDFVYNDDAVFECDSGLCPAQDFCYALGEKRGSGRKLLNPEKNSGKLSLSNKR